MHRCMLACLFLLIISAELRKAPIEREHTAESWPNTLNTRRLDLKILPTMQLN